jgi:hypothetical protein
MSLTGLAAVRAALEGALNGMSPSLATAWENVPYEPTNGTAWQRATLLPAEPDNLEIGGLITERGLMQVTLCYPLNAGVAAPLARAELIRSTFPRGASFTSDGVTTTIERTPEIGPATAEPDYFSLPVRIRYFAHH